MLRLTPTTAREHCAAEHATLSARYPDHVALLKIGTFWESFGSSAETMGAVFGHTHALSPELGTVIAWLNKQGYRVVTRDPHDPNGHYAVVTSTIHADRIARLRASLGSLA